jgi:hypothetical protein
MGSLVSCKLALLLPAAADSPSRRELLRRLVECLAKAGAPLALLRVPSRLGADVLARFQLACPNARLRPCDLTHMQLKFGTPKNQAAHFFVPILLKCFT